MRKPIKFILSYSFKFILVIIVATFLNTLFLRIIPGDPVEASLGRGVDEETKEIIAKQLGLNKGFLMGFIQYIVKLSNGDLGESLLTNESVGNLIKLKIMTSLELIFFAFFFGFPLSIGVGIIAVRHQGGKFDKIVQGTAISLTSIPAYSLSILLLLVGSYYLNLFPSSGRIGVSFRESFTPHTGLYLIDAVLQGNLAILFDIIHHMFLPVITLILCVIFPIVSRMILNAVKGQIGNPHLIALKAVGIPPRVIFWKHLMRAVLPPLISFGAVLFALMLGGAIIIEYIFGWDGFGSLIVKSMLQRDYPVIQGCVVLTSIIFVLVSIMTDLVVGIIDPRTRK